MRALLASLSVALVATAAVPAYAKASVDLRYRLDETFTTAVRYVRVDRGCKVTDQDANAAFVVFECPLEDKKVSRGALEIFRVANQGRSGVRVQVTLSDEPHGAELRLIELLERKLRDERGTPADPSPAPPSVPDAGVKRE